MNSNTHIAVGIASSFVIIQPQNNIKHLILGSTLAAIGSIISDIDIHNSKANKIIDKTIWIIGVVGITSLIIDYLFKLQIYNNVLNNIAIMKILVSILLFSIVAMFAKTTSHRSFSHSIIGITAFFIPVSIIFDSMSQYFLIGIVSHVIIDLFNKKKVQILYPFKKGICFKFCTSNGLTNNILFFASTIYILYITAIFIYNTSDFIVALF